MTSVGYGDIQPHNSEERTLVIVLMVTAAILFGKILNDVSALIQRYDR